MVLGLICCRLMVYELRVASEIDLETVVFTWLFGLIGVL